MSVISLWCISVKYKKVVGVTGLNTPQIDNISFVDQRGHQSPSLIALFLWSCRQTLTPLGLRPPFVKSWIRHCICKRNAKHSQCTWIPWWHDFTTVPKPIPEQFPKPIPDHSSNQSPNCYLSQCLNQCLNHSPNQSLSHSQNLWNFHARIWLVISPSPYSKC